MSLSVSSSRPASPLSPVDNTFDVADVSPKVPLKLAVADSGYDPDHVNRAANKVVKAFASGTVWNSDLHQIAAAVHGMSPPERRAFVNTLALTRPAGGSQDYLKLWVGECTTHGVGPYAGLEPGERMHLWTDLVAGQDPTNLNRLWQAAASHNRYDHGAQPYRGEFAEAVARAGTSAQKVGVIAGLAPSAARGDSVSANAIAHVFGGLASRGEADAGLARIDRKTMDRVVAASISVKGSIGVDSFGGTTVVTSVDTSAYRRMAVAVARSGNPREKAAFVAASGRLFGKLEDAGLDGDVHRQSKSDVARGMSAVIGSDVNGVVENTLLQNSMRGGSDGRAALKNYVTALIDAHQASDIGAITLSLQRGNDLTQDPMRYLSQRASRGNEVPDYAHARVLGEWIAVAASAVQSRISSRDLNAGFASLLFTGGLDVMKELSGTAFPALKLPLGIATATIKPALNAALLTWRNGLARSDREFGRSLYETALPRNAQGVEATAPWVTTFDAHFAAGQGRQ